MPSRVSPDDVPPTITAEPSRSRAYARGGVRSNQIRKGEDPLLNRKRLHAAPGGVEEQEVVGAEPHEPEPASALAHEVGGRARTHADSDSARLPDLEDVVDDVVDLREWHGSWIQAE